MKRCALLLSLFLLLLALPALGRPVLSSSERAQVEREIRASARWQFALYDGRRPTLRTVIRPVRGRKDQFTATAEIFAIWRGARAPLAENQFTITRGSRGLTVASPRPFLPK